MDTRTPKVIVDRLAFPNCPRWRDGFLWFSDVHASRVMRTGEDGGAQIVTVVEGRPAGLDWLPDGRMQVVSMQDRRLYRLDGRRLEVVAELSKLTKHPCNDLVMDRTGRAYVGHYGFNVDAGEPAAPASLFCIEPDGETWVVVEGLQFPNGVVITPDGGTLIVAETTAQRLSAYDVASDGSLDNARVWADLRPNVPDGICLDAEGAVWVADPVQQGVMRVVEGRGAVDWIQLKRPAYACTLGGADGHTLFVCTSESADPKLTMTYRPGRIETVRVDVGAPPVPA